MKPDSEVQLRIYEHVPQEIDEALVFRNTIFGQITKAQWTTMNCTAVVARSGERLVGFIPLQFREQCLRPGMTMPVAYENAVGVAEGMRSQGIGTQMIDEAARFMSDRVDALMVIRGGEQSDGYRFYRKTGHGDVSYMRSYELPPETAWPSVDERGISVLDRAQWLALEPKLLDLYERRYGRFGGQQMRRAGYWKMVLDGHVYRNHKWWLVALWDDADRLDGYLVASSGWWRTAQGVHVYEVVGRDDKAVARLLRYARRFAAGGRYGVPHVSLANPIRPLLREMRFVESASSPHVMARILRPDRIFQRLAAGSNLVDTLSLTASTPHRTLVVNDPPAPKYVVRFETKESLLSRLFCCRLDLEMAIDAALVRWNGTDPGLKRELCRTFAPAEWVLWFTDFV